MWGEKAASPIHGLHAFHSVGVVLAVPLVGGFLSTKNETLIYTIGNDSLPGDSENRWQNLSMLKNDSNENENPTRIHIPYGIMGGVGVIAAFSFVVFHITGWTFTNLVEFGANVNKETIEVDQQTDLHTQEMDGEQNDLPHSSVITTKDRKINIEACFRWIFIVGLFICYAAMMYRDAMLSTYLFPIAVKGRLEMTKTQATYLTTGFSAAYAIGRVASIFYSHYIDIHILVYLESILVFIGSVLLAIIGLDGKLHLWIIACFLGFTQAPSYPSVMSWANHYIPVTGLIVAAIDIGSGAGISSCTWAGGYIFDHLGPIYILYVTVTFSFLLIAILTIMQSIGYVKKRRMNTEVKQLDASKPIFNNCEENIQ